MTADKNIINKATSHRGTYRPNWIRRDRIVIAMKKFSPPRTVAAYISHSTSFTLTFKLLQRFVVVLMGGRSVVVHRTVVTAWVKLVVMHTTLQMITVQSCHRGCRSGVLMMLYRYSSWRTGDQVLEAEVRVTSSTPSEIEASSASTSLHAVERERRVAVAKPPSFFTLHFNPYIDRNVLFTVNYLYQNIHPNFDSSERFINASDFRLRNIEFYIPSPFIPPLFTLSTYKLTEQYRTRSTRELQ